VLRSGALFVTFGLLSVAGLSIQACGSSTGASSRPGGTAASAATGEGGEQASGGSAGSSATSGGVSGKGGSGTVSTGGTAGSSAANGGAADGGTSATASGGSAATIGAAGSGTTGTGTACDNGIDDDADGLVDGLDPECTGAFDQDEGSFATGIPGDNQDPKWQDCFFDGNSGGGDDGCRYSTDCLLGNTAADDADCELAQVCIDYCARLTPNGCDCFGCCTVQTPDGSNVDILTATTCSLETIGDEEACPRCQKSIACDNPCGECELCPGKTVADLPESCVPPPPTGEGGNGGAPDGTGGSTGGTPSTGGTGGAPPPPPPAYTCDGGETVCGPELPRCSTGLYCQLGCCMPLVR
jgi:hypothetical protein